MIYRSLFSDQGFNSLTQYSRMAAGGVTITSAVPLWLAMSRMAAGGLTITFSVFSVFSVVSNESHGRRRLILNQVLASLRLYVGGH